MLNTTGEEVDFGWSLVMTVLFGLAGIIHLLAYGTNKSLYVQAWKTIKLSHNEAAHASCCVWDISGCEMKSRTYTTANWDWMLN